MAVSDSYRHTQVAYKALALTLAVTCVMALRTSSLAPAFVVAVFWLFFGRLTIAVADGRVSCAFGVIGLPRTSFALADVERAQKVRTSPLAGWGIRYTLHGRLWNVWGLDAVELRLRNGRTFRMGTDEPAALLSALRHAGVSADQTPSSGV